jgi:hypothetical protein
LPFSSIENLSVLATLICEMELREYNKRQMKMMDFVTVFLSKVKPNF